jgi:hypothetical protein
MADISATEEITYINNIKNRLFTALQAFEPDLPTQFSSQLGSIVIKMQDTNEMLRDINEFKGFLKLYKIKLEDFVGMITPSKHNSWDIEKDNSVDTMANIRAKIVKYEQFFSKLYEKITPDTAQLNLRQLEMLITTLTSDHHKPVNRGVDGDNKSKDEE